MKQTKTSRAPVGSGYVPPLPQGNTIPGGKREFYKAFAITVLVLFAGTVLGTVLAVAVAHFIH